MAGNVATSVLTQVCLVVSGVAAARILGVTDRGRSTLLLMFGVVLPVIGTAGLPLSVTYWIAKDVTVGRRLMASLRKIIALQIGVVVAVHAIILIILFHDAGTSVRWSAAVSLLVTPPMVAWIYGLAVLQGTQQFRELNTSRLFFPPLNAAILMVLLAGGFGTLFGVTLVWVGLYSMTAVITTIYSVRGLREAARADTGEPLPSNGTMVRFGLKAMLGSVTPLEGFQLDQAIVGLFISQAALGIYTVAVAFTNMPRFIARSIGLVAYPHVAAGKDGRGPGASTLRFVALTLILCGLTVGVTEIALPTVLPLLFGHEFESAVGVARILLVSALLFGLRNVLSECARGAGRPALGSIAEVVSLVTLFPFVVLFASSEAKGVAAALVIAAFAGVATIAIGMVVRPLETASRTEPLEVEPAGLEPAVATSEASVILG